MVSSFLLVVLLASGHVEGFQNNLPSQQLSGRHQHYQHRHQQNQVLNAAAVAIPNPFNQLPWNVEKEKKRQIRRLKLERSRLHRQLGIAEDATYEEIVMATDRLISLTNGDIKAKIKIEIAKDKILQIRLNERLAGLTTLSHEVKAQSRHESEGSDEEEEESKGSAEWNFPLWTQGLIVKPDDAHKKRQIRLWGAITAVGLAFVPAQDYLGRFTWLICVAQLTFRGMPQEMTEGGGLGISFGGGGKGGHRKVAWLLGLSTWIISSSLVYGLMPVWAKGRRWSGSLAFSMLNLCFGTACSYLQPYKG